MHQIRSLFTLQLLVTLTLLSTMGVAIAKSEFPGRKIYPYVDYISLKEFKKIFDSVTIVDVRSKYEYKTLRIKGAISIPLSSRKFVQNMRKLRAENDRPIVVYCNGKSCYKSYKAVTKTNTYNIKNVVAFDAGIVDWAKTYPMLAVLLGDILKNPKQLISKEYFNKHKLSPEDFTTKMTDKPSIVIDIRDRFQREGLSLFSGLEKRVPLDDNRRLDRYIKKAKMKKKSLFVFDAAGKQVRWLQYYLEKKGVKNYYFMTGGIRSYYDTVILTGKLTGN